MHTTSPYNVRCSERSECSTTTLTHGATTEKPGEWKLALRKKKKYEKYFSANYLLLLRIMIIITSETYWRCKKLKHTLSLAFHMVGTPPKRSTATTRHFPLTSLPAIFSFTPNAPCPHFPCIEEKTNTKSRVNGRRTTIIISVWQLRWAEKPLVVYSFFAFFTVFVFRCAQLQNMPMVHVIVVRMGLLWRQSWNEPISHVYKFCVRHCGIAFVIIMFCDTEHRSSATKIR